MPSEQAAQNMNFNFTQTFLTLHAYLNWRCTDEMPVIYVKYM